MRTLALVVAAVVGCRGASHESGSESGSAATPGSSSAPIAKAPQAPPQRRTSTEGPASVDFTAESQKVHALHALADIGPNDMTIFISTMALTCRDLHGDAIMQAGGVALMLPVGPDRDYYAGKKVGVDTWALGSSETFALAPAFVTLAIDHFDPNTARISGEVHLAGRAHAIGNLGVTQRLAGGGRFDAGICDDFGTLAAPIPKPTVQTETPFGGSVAAKPFTLAHAYAIVCGAPGNRFVARLELSAASDATCTSFWDGLHVEIDAIGGSAEQAPLLGTPQPAASSVGDGLAVDSRPGTASVTWQHLDYEIGGTVSGAAQLESLGDHATAGRLWTDASGTFSAQVCADDLHICRVSGG